MDEINTLAEKGTDLVFIEKRGVAGQEAIRSFGYNIAN